MQAATQILDSVSRETRLRLEAYLDLVEQWNRHMNLVSHGDWGSLLSRHLLDSIGVANLVGPCETIADLGSGAGFPGLVMAIVLDREITLIEANRRKAAFLREAARLTQAPVIIHGGRVEEMAERYDLITARAVAPLATLFGLVVPRLTPTGKCLLPKGREFASEINSARKKWLFRHTVHPSQTDPLACILEVTDIYPALLS